MFFLLVVFSFTSLSVAETDPVLDSSYVAAVYEHNLILNPDPRVPLSRLEALQHLQKNLDVYEEQAARAAQQVLSGQETVLLTNKDIVFKKSRRQTPCSVRLCPVGHVFVVAASLFFKLVTRY